MPSPYALDFTPLNTGLNQLAGDAFKMQAADFYQQRLGMEKQRTESDLATAGLGREAEAAKLYGGVAEAGLALPDGPQRQQVWQRILQSHPEMATHIKNNGIDPADYNGGLNALSNEARGYRAPEDVEARRLQNELTQTQIDAGRIIPMQPGGYALRFDRNGNMTTIGGGDAFSDYGPNGEAPGTFQAPAGAHGQPQPAAPSARGSSAPPTPQQGGATQPQPQPQPSPQAQSQAPLHDYAAGYAGYANGPQAGTPTALASGDAAPGMQKFPPLYSPEDVQRLRREEHMSPRMATAAQNTEGSIERNEYGREMGKNIANFENTRKSLDPVLAMMDDIKQDAIKAGPGILHMATGPTYGSNDGSSYLPGIATSGGAYQAARKGISDILHPWQMVTGEQNDADKAYALNTKMQHLKKAVATLYKSVPGAGGKGGGTDQSQRELEDAIGEMMKTADPETFFQILHDATNTARGLGAYEPMARQERYSPWDASGKLIQQPQAAPQNGQGGWKYVAPYKPGG